MSSLALVLTLAFIFFLFWRESRQRIKLSGALWIPLIWFVAAGSKGVGLWLGMTPPTELSEPSPIDAALFLALLVAGCRVLQKRHVTLAQFIRNNRWLTVFLVYCLVAVLWSELPFVAFKRWLKVIGNVIMVLIVLTDPEPEKAIQTVLKRAAYLLVPISILLINYYPQYGQVYDRATRIVTYVGATDDKNTLGHDCMILGLFFFWNTLYILRRQNYRGRRGDLFWSGAFLAMTCWLLWTANSSTSKASMLLGMLMVMLLGLPFVNRRLVGTYLLVGILAFVGADMVFGFYSSVVQSLGRDATFSGRTELWPDLLRLQPNPILGAGFESFWVGERVDELWAKYNWHPAEAHNGYLETYLNLGAVGLVLLVGLILATFSKIRLELLRRFEVGRFRLAFLLAILIYNFTEAAFGGVHGVYTMFFLVAVDYPAIQRLRPKRLSEAARSKGEQPAAYGGV
jgi:O-antigen ligase